jgi:hypothetical protein
MHTLLCGRTQNDSTNFRRQEQERTDSTDRRINERVRSQKLCCVSREFKSLKLAAQQPHGNYTPSTILIAFHVAPLKRGKLSVELWKSTIYIVSV